MLLKLWRGLLSVRFVRFVAISCVFRWDVVVMRRALVL
jgi:hypothetical protein